MDFKNKSIFELQSIRVEIDELIEKKKIEQRSKVQEEIQRIASENGFTLEQLMGLKAKSKKKVNSPTDKRFGTAPTKYVNKDGSTWSGRGRRPHWITAILDSGGKIEDYAV